MQGPCLCRGIWQTGGHLLGGDGPQSKRSDRRTPVPPGPDACCTGYAQQVQELRGVPRGAAVLRGESTAPCWFPQRQTINRAGRIREGLCCRRTGTCHTPGRASTWEALPRLTSVVAATGLGLVTGL